MLWREGGMPMLSAYGIGLFPVPRRVTRPSWVPLPWGSVRFVRVWLMKEYVRKDFSAMDYPGSPGRTTFSR
jgi:hypothetical protein